MTISKGIKEKISALSDGELSEFETIGKNYKSQKEHFRTKVLFLKAQIYLCL